MEAQNQRSTLFFQGVLLMVSGLSLAACSSSSEPVAVLPPPAVAAGAYSEIYEFAEVEEHLGLLQAHGLGLLRVMSPADFGAPALTSLIDACAAQGIEFRAWIVLPEDQGYWPGESNVEHFAQAVDDFLAWVQADGLPVGWVTFDVEPSWTYTEELLTIAKDTDNPDRTKDLVDLIETHHDPTAYAASTAAFQSIVEQVQAAGLRAHVVTYPLVLDDLADGDTDIQDGLDTPIEGIGWDQVTFMTYRSVLNALGGAEVQPSIFYSYGYEARQAFGARAGLDFGLVGTGYVTVDGGYEDPAILRTDVSAARAAGIDQMHLYSFEGARELGNPNDWLPFATAPAATEYSGEPDTQPMRALFALLDAILDGAGEP